MELTINTDIDSIRRFFDQLDEISKRQIIDDLVYDTFIDSLEKHLTGKGDIESWSTSGWRSGSEVRKHIAEVSGIETELRKDYESKIKALDREVAHLKPFYDWYYKVYHFDYDQHKRLLQAVGDPTSKKE